MKPRKQVDIIDDDTVDQCRHTDRPSPPSALIT